MTFTFSKRGAVGTSKFLLGFRKNGDPNPAELAANATKILASFGFTTDDITTLATADEAGVTQLFTAKSAALETAVLERKGKEIRMAAELAGKKYAYTETEKRARAALAEYGVIVSDEEFAAMDEKTRIETLIKHGIKVKTTTEGGSVDEQVAAYKTKYEAALAGESQVKQTAAQLKTELDKLKADLPSMREQIELEVFADNQWQLVAFHPDVVKDLIVQDQTVLRAIVLGAMAEKGHKFVGEKNADGKLVLNVVDSKGALIQAPGAMGNHTPASYIKEAYASLVKKSNGGEGGGGGNSINFDKDFKVEDLDEQSLAALEAMKKQRRQN